MSAECASICFFALKSVGLQPDFEMVCSSAVRLDEIPQPLHPSASSLAAPHAKWPLSCRMTTSEVVTSTSGGGGNVTVEIDSLLSRKMDEMSATSFIRCQPSHLNPHADAEE